MAPPCILTWRRRRGRRERDGWAGLGARRVGRAGARGRGRGPRGRRRLARRERALGREGRVGRRRAGRRAGRRRARPLAGVHLADVVVGVGVAEVGSPAVRALPVQRAGLVVAGVGAAGAAGVAHVLRVAVAGVGQGAVVVVVLLLHRVHPRPVRVVGVVAGHLGQERRPVGRVGERRAVAGPADADPVVQRRQRLRVRKVALHGVLLGEAAVAHQLAAQAPARLLGLREGEAGGAVGVADAAVAAEHRVAAAWWACSCPRTPAAAPAATPAARPATRAWRARGRGRRPRAPRTCKAARWRS
jgi:hypothetical protein